MCLQLGSLDESTMPSSQGEKGESAKSVRKGQTRLTDSSRSRLFRHQEAAVIVIDQILGMLPEPPSAFRQLGIYTGASFTTIEFVCVQISSKTDLYG